MKVLPPLRRDSHIRGTPGVLALFVDADHYADHVTLHCKIVAGKTVCVEGDQDLRHAKNVLPYIEAAARGDTPEVVAIVRRDEDELAPGEAAGDAA